MLSRKPQPPLPGKGAGGRVGTGSSIGAYARKMLALEKVDKDIDPREAVLKYAEVGLLVRERGVHVSGLAGLLYIRCVNHLSPFAVQVAKDKPFWVAPAYQATQPKPVFLEEEDSDEETK